MIPKMTAEISSILLTLSIRITIRNVSSHPPFIQGIISAMSLKELSLCLKLWLSDDQSFATQCRRTFLKIFQTKDSITLSGFKDTEIRKFEFVTKTQFLYKEKYVDELAIADLTILLSCI